MFFSVIVPIFKVERYLVRCIESVLTQSFIDFELILVDDGSPDGCPQICNCYLERDSRVKVIHKENGGLVSARQAGIKMAEGEYVFHLDGDDALAAGALEEAYKVILKTKADIVSFSYICCRNNEPDETVGELLKEGLYEKQDIIRNFYPHILLDENMRHMLYFVWGKAIKRELAMRHQLNVDPSVSLGEDICCMLPCYLQADKVYVSKTAAYLYTIRDDSMSTDFQTNQFVQLERVVKTLYNLEGEKPEDFQQQISRYYCFMSFAILAAAAEGKHFDKLEELKKMISNSVYRAEFSKARFANITFKSRVAVYLMKKNRIGMAFYFLYLCKCIKRILGKKG